ncbi:MAG: hypothetical protein WC378_01290 [Opitutaceae bacterium]|jgi:hypothetical protein
MAKSHKPSKAKKSLFQRQLDQLIKKLAETKKIITPFQLAQLAVELANMRKDPEPRKFFPQANQLLVSAERYMAEGISAIVEHVEESPAGLAILMSNILMPGSPIGWEVLLTKLEGTVRKRSGRVNRVLSHEEVSMFLMECFSDPVSGLPEEEGKRTQGKDFIHQLDGGRLSQENVQMIIEKWRYYRKELTRKATVGRKKQAADERSEATAKEKRFSKKY